MDLQAPAAALRPDCWSCWSLAPQVLLLQALLQL
jgi:hypothetical protein